jgi:hypothetical protein
MTAVICADDPGFYTSPVSRPSRIVTDGVRLIRRSAVFLLTALIVSAPALPPEHSHPANQDHGGVMHRHWSMHLARHSAHASIDEDDGRILWIDAGFVSAARASHGAPIAFIADAPMQRPPLLAVGLVANGRDPARVHGPAIDRRSSRAPPSSIVL